MMKNNLDKLFLYISLICMIILSFGIIGGGYFSNKFGFYISFGEFNWVLGSVGLSFSFSLLLVVVYEDIKK